MVDLRPRPSARKTAARRGAAGGAAREGLWHRPALLNLISDVLLLASAAILGYAVVMWAANRPSFRLREVVVLTPPAQVSAEQLEYAARSAVKGNFFTVDLDKVRDAFEKLPWVRHAQVRRRWPDALELRLEEHQAVAYWTVTDSGDTRLVNAQGEVFVAASNAHMPVFAGPEGYAPILLSEYARFSQTLKPLGHALVEVGLSAREAWQLKLDDGLVIRLGRDRQDAPAEARLQRFVAAYPKALAQRPMQVAVADLRYPNGFALLPMEGGNALENGK
ncbi:FtsQ-type POTRA domain-containing protein [Nitrogeniibacter mangrovi]|uniref:Cell division protein FtsQ n=1 Tax=Nitrogeniibacter mangrovi TaxID=2016596 RepID=A0A6C1B4A3_9RHOO|nr:cell division protein FtsQ/DivIB [Nitrogeniibacter mangrovi]QID17034.1 FtsQ-type POTRA domain-containing protein [Nitrogeniibacter mangrovi]